MFKADAQEAALVCRTVLSALLTAAPTRGRPGSDLRTAVGDFLAEADAIIQNDQAGAPLDEIFVLAQQAGVTQAQLASVRVIAANESPVSVGATIIKNALIEFSLATEGRIIADMTFTSREDVEALRLEMNDAFEPMEEIAADDMAQMTYRALIALHAAIAFHLAETARPLPRMLSYSFYQTLPTVLIAYRLYADASRADEIRAENKIVHPAFAPLQGRALSN
jgi:prophage DNA circulation protein